MYLIINDNPYNLNPEINVVKKDNFSMLCSLELKMPTAKVHYTKAKIIK
jgi:hypothetical protein